MCVSMRSLIQITRQERKYNKRMKISGGHLEHYFLVLFRICLFGEKRCKSIWSLTLSEDEKQYLSTVMRI